MNPHSLFLKNVRTFDEVSLDLPEGLLAVLGSNGAGKSTLISAIDVCLFGPEGRSLAPWYPRGLGTDPLTIELVFEHAQQWYRVRRSFSPKGRGLSKMEFERGMAGPTVGEVSPMGPMPNADGTISHDRMMVWEPLSLESQTATQDLLTATIGLSRETFRASSYLAQGESGRFCDAQPRERKAILAEVVGLAEWEGWLERARAEKRTCELELAEKRALLERADTELAERGRVEAEQAAATEREQQLRGALAEAAAGLAAAREALAEAKQRVERRTGAERAHSATQDAVLDLKGRIVRVEAEMAGLDRRLAERDILASTAAALGALEDEQMALQAAARVWEERGRLVTEAESLGGQAADLHDQAKVCWESAARVLAGIGQEHCDRCQQVLGAEAAERAAESYRAEATELGRKGSETLAKLEILNRQLATLPADQPNLDRLPVVEAQIRQAQQASVQVSALDEAAARRVRAAGELDGMRAELPTRERASAVALADVQALGPHDPAEARNRERDLRDLELSEMEVRRELDAAVALVARSSERLERLTTLAAEVDANRADVETLLHRLEISTAMERACGANGIPALILENVAIPQVEAEASRLLRVLGGPATGVELRTQRETKTGGISDTLDIILQTETGEAPYESFSGGERARIAFALRIALAQLLAGRKGADTGLLILDELEGLDAEGIAALVGVLEELQQTIPRIILISHQIELRDSFPQSLTLENVDGHSEILNGN